MLRHLGAGQRSWFIQYVFSVSLKLKALSVEGGGWINSRVLMLTSAVPEWSSLEKWRPTPSVCFLCLMLKNCELNLSLCYGIFGLSHLCQMCHDNMNASIIFAI